MMKEIDFIPQMRPLFGDDDKDEIRKYLNEDGFFTEFKRTETFERMLSQYTNAKNCIVVNNGTVSLTLAGLALGIGHGDEVIVPNYTMIATPNAFKILGAKPVFVDVEPETLVIDIERVVEAITSRTKAIVLVSANGRAPKAGIEQFESLSIEMGIPLIEDAAQSLGSKYPDMRHIGTAGIMGSISFSAPKIISTGQGGAIITNNDMIAERLRRLKDFGRAAGGNDIHDSIGYNFKFTEVQACLGISQMKQLEARVERKKEIWKRYHTNLKNVRGIRLYNHDLELCAPWFIDAMAEDRNGLSEYLKEHNIGTRHMYPPINKQKAYGESVTYNVSEEVGRNGIWLPSMVQLSDDMIDRVCYRINKFYTH